MKVHFGKAVFDFPSEQLGELRDSSDLISNPAALHQRMDEDGCLLLRGLIDREKVLAARESILAYMAEHEGLEPGSRPLDGVMGQYGKSVAMMGRRPITHEPGVKDVLESTELFDFYNRHFGQPSLTFDYKWLRAVGKEDFTGAHLDVVYMGRGTPGLMTCWIPLGDIPIEQGTLALCVGSHRDPGFAKVRETYGRMDVDRDHIEGWFSRNPQEVITKFGGRWCTTNFRAGDIVTFGMYTMHASTTNVTDRWRISCDVRFQPAGEPVDPRWVGKGNIRGHNPGTDPMPMTEARAMWGL